jgi:hypothetical protein
MADAKISQLPASTRPLAGSEVLPVVQSSTTVQTSVASLLDFGGSGALFRNRLINGNMTVDQRNSGALQTFTAAAPVAYSVDRWYASCTGANITGQRVSGTSPNLYAYKFTGAASNTGLIFGQRIESFNCADLVSKTVVGSLTVSSSSITTLTWTAYYADSTNTFSTKTQIATGTITITSTPTNYSLSFNAGASAANGIALEFSCGALTATNTLQFQNVQLESGSIATAFEQRPYSTQLILSQRYYYRLSAAADATIIGGLGYAVSVTTARGIDYFPVTMRIAPTALEQTGTATDYRVYGAGAVATVCSAVPTFNSATVDWGRTSMTVTAGLTLGLGSNHGTNSGTSSPFPYLGWSAEL